MGAASDPSIRGRPAAVSVDVAGTLLHPAEPIGVTYAHVARAHGHAADDGEVEARVWTAMSELSAMRRGDPSWRVYWREVVRRAVRADDAAVFDDLYEHYAHAAAWTLAPGAGECLRALADAGMGLGVVSNWDTRLRPLLERLGVAATFDAVLISGEVGVEKPDPRIFELACERLGVDASQLLHVGDREDADVGGARAAGCRALWYGRDVRDFDELRTVLLRPS